MRILLVRQQYQLTSPSYMKKSPSSKECDNIIFTPFSYLWEKNALILFLSTHYNTFTHLIVGRYENKPHLTCKKTWNYPINLCVWNYEVTPPLWSEAIWNNNLLFRVRKYKITCSFFVWDNMKVFERLHEITPLLRVIK